VNWVAIIRAFLIARALLRELGLEPGRAQQLEVDPDLLRAHPSSCCCPNCEERLILDDF